MKQPVILIVFTVFFFSQCGLIDNKNRKRLECLCLLLKKTQEHILAEEKIRQDRFENVALELIEKTAFGELVFGMEKELVERINEKKQLLVKFNSSFANSFNDESKLNKLKIKSKDVKAIYFDTNLKDMCQNLYEIIKTKCGEPSTSQKFPSIFDVQNNKQMRTIHWGNGNM